LANIKEIKRLRGGDLQVAAQANVQIDAEIGQKDYFRMETVDNIVTPIKVNGKIPPVCSPGASMRRGRGSKYSDRIGFFQPRGRTPPVARRSRGLEPYPTRACCSIPEDASHGNKKNQERIVKSGTVTSFKEIKISDRQSIRANHRFRMK